MKCEALGPGDSRTPVMSPGVQGTRGGHLDSVKMWTPLERLRGLRGLRGCAAFWVVVTFEAFVRGEFQFLPLKFRGCFRCPRLKCVLEVPYYACCCPVPGFIKYPGFDGSALFRADHVAIPHTNKCLYLV